MSHRIRCQRCGTNYLLDESRIKNKNAKLTCRKCGYKIFMTIGEGGIQILENDGTDPKSSVLPPTIGKYQVVQSLGSGGMGEVFLARKSGVAGFEKLVVLKVLHPHLARDETFAAAMADEAKITVILNHPNIVQMYDLERHEDILFAVMEYVPGLSLHAVQRNYRHKAVPIPLDMALYVICETLEGLAFAHDFQDNEGHRLNIVHRDISPHNIMVSRDSWVKIIDFGIAKAATRVSHTQPGNVKGKFAYMSPEQLKGLADHRSDLFAVGVILWELLTGLRLFRGSSDVETLRRVLQLVPPPIRSYRMDIAPGIDRILAKALEKDPLNRYQSAREFRTDILAFAKPSTMAELKSAVVLDPGVEFTSIDSNELRDSSEITPSLKDMTSKDVFLRDGTQKTSGRRVATLAGAVVLLLGVAIGATLMVSGGPAMLTSGSPAALLDASVAVAEDAGPSPAQEPPADSDAGLAGTDQDGPVPDTDPDAGPGPSKVQVALHRPPEPPPLPAPIVLDRAMIERSLRRSGASLQRCADLHLKQTTEIVLEFIILSDGRVDAVGIQPEAVGKEAFGRCLALQVRGIRFPRHAEKSVKARFPLKFEAVNR